MTINDQTPADAQEPASPQAWEAFIRGEVEATDRAYLAKPDFLLGHGRGERGATRDYAGRELLELVQNAADAATEAGIDGRVHIEITSSGLIVANTGEPFRTGGVTSLMAANTSDKPNRPARLIGAKGLGFRALLNWSSEPFITSGPLEIAFSRAHAQSHARGLAERSPELAQLVAGADADAPVLAFPMVGADIGKIDDEALTTLMERARSLRAEGYDTAVVARFDSADALRRAIAQADEFKPQFLLFVPTLEEIHLRVVGRPLVRWRRTAGPDDQLTLTLSHDDAVEEQVWTCRRRSGQVTTTRGQAGAFEMAVAVQHGAQTPGRLHTYFPTDIPLPFPALLHATLELDSNRKALNAASTVNDAVLNTLAEFYAETVALAAKAKTHDPLHLLGRTTLFPDVLKTFETAVYRAAAPRKIIPTMKGPRVAAADTLLGPPGYETFFPRRLFGDLALCRHASDREVVERLGVKQLDVRKALSVLRSADLTLKERAAVVLGMVKRLPKDLHDRRFLVDAEGRTLTQNNICFTDPSSTKPPTLPTWARARIMHPELWRMINAGLVGTPRGRVQQLAGFAVNEFNVDGVITSLRAQFVLVQARGQADLDRMRRELLQAVLSLYRRDGRKSAYPAGRLDVACADGVWRDGRGVHLSEPYGSHGAIVSALYTSRPDLLLAAPEANGLSGETEELARFFQWIGVHPWPKAAAEAVPVDLRPVLLAALPETFEVSDGVYQDTIKRSELVWWDGRIQHDTVEGLTDILAHASSEAILAWLALDLRASRPFATRLSARTGRKQHRNYRGALPDLFHHRVGSTPWLDTRSTGRAAPRDAMMSPGRLGELFPAPAAFRDDNPFGMTREDWARGLFVAGVPRSLAELGEARTFNLLDGLEARGVSTELVRRVYGQILELEDFEPARAEIEAARFLTEGRLQVRQGGTVGWAPVSETFYLDRDNIPAAARDLVALIDLPSRRNTADVQARFGAAPLSRRKQQMRVVEQQEEAGAIAGVLCRRWAAALPYIRAHRRAANADLSTFKPVERLRLVVCTHAMLEISLENQTRLAELDRWKHIIAGDDLIVVVEPLASEEEIIFFAAEALGDAIAELLGLQSGADFTRLLSAPGDALRAAQLRRMLTHRSAEEIEALMAELEPDPVEIPSHEVDAALLARALAPRPAPATPSAPTPLRPTAPVSPSPQTPTPSPAPAPPALAPMVGVTATVQSPSAPVASTSIGGGGGGGGLRIGGATGPLGAPRDPEKPADAESWAEFYETTDGRFPLVVKRLQGKGSFGCDLLSFASAADREAFKAEPARTALIVRYIEVKSGGVRLEANEIDAAQKHGPKFFVYRILFEGDGREAAALTLISDPLSHGRAIARECEIRMDEIETRVRVRLTAVRAAA